MLLKIFIFFKILKYEYKLNFLFIWQVIIRLFKFELFYVTVQLYPNIESNNHFCFKIILL